MAFEVHHLARKLRLRHTVSSVFSMYSLKSCYSTGTWRPERKITVEKRAQVFKI